MACGLSKSSALGATKYRCSTELLLTLVPPECIKCKLGRRRSVDHARDVVVAIVRQRHRRVRAAARAQSCAREERRLLEQLASETDPRAPKRFKDQLVLANMWLVSRLTKRYRALGLDLADLQQEGVMA
jgi:DNA-directed RNA polymerase sigma subunit (sigma70/sigma32)